MTWLKKIGTVVLKIIGIATGVLPLISQAGLVPQSTATSVADRLTSALNAIVTAEQMFTAANGADAKTGSQKLAAATPYVTTLVQDAIALLPNNPKLKDSAKFEAACTAITSALADALNAYGD